MFSIALSSRVATSSLPTKCDCVTLQPSKIHTAVSMSFAWQGHRRGEPPLEEAIPPLKVCLSLLRIAAQKKKSLMYVIWTGWFPLAGIAEAVTFQVFQFYRNKKTMCANHAGPEIRSQFWLENKVNHGFITQWPLQAGLQPNEAAIVQRLDSGAP